MHDHPALILMALLIFGFGLFSQKAEHFPVTGPMVFVATGLFIGPLGLNLVSLHISSDTVKVVAEITLILILFTDASMIQFNKLAKVLAGLPARLLLIGLPLSIAAGGGMALWLLPQLDLVWIVLVALMLAPTDAALGQAVIKSPDVPLNIRESVSIESGLNDGIVLPPIIVAMAIITDGAQVLDGSNNWFGFMLKQLTLGPLIGAMVGLAGGFLVDRAASNGWMEGAFQRLSSISLALMAYAAAELFHGNGFIAAFFAGLMLGAKTPAVRERIQEFGEAEGQLLSLFVFLLFGMLLVPYLLPFWDLNALVYALLSLTVIRMLPVAVSMIGAGYDLKSVGFVGWFGPRGIASILYLLMLIGTVGVSGYEYAYGVVTLTVLLSTFLHGVSAVPLCRRFNSTQ
ncbi:MAG: cation:proton antiporter [Cellvibrionaceae bacterium]